MPQEVSHLFQLGIDLEDVAAKALRDGLASILPFRAMCRVYGAFLAEGCEVFARSIVALWSHRRGLLRTSPGPEFAQSLLLPPRTGSGVLEVPYAPDGRDLSRATTMDLAHMGGESCSRYGGLLLGVEDLANMASAIKIPASLQNVKVKDAVLPTCLADSSVMMEGRLCCRPRLSGDPSSLVWDALWPYMWQWLPQLERTLEPLLTFSSKRDGYNLTALLCQCEKAQSGTPMFLVVR